MLPSSARRLDCVSGEAFVKPHTLDRRIDILQQKVETLETLPDRVSGLEVQISEFRTELRVEFSATRTELRQEMQALNDQTRAEMRALNDETGTHMRVLHEAVIARFNLLEEHPAWKRPTVPRRPKR